MVTHIYLDIGYTLFIISKLLSTRFHMGYSFFDPDKFFVACLMVIAAFPASAFALALFLHFFYKA